MFVGILHTHGTTSAANRAAQGSVILYAITIFLSKMFPALYTNNRTHQHFHPFALNNMLWASAFPKYLIHKITQLYCSLAG